MQAFMELASVWPGYQQLLGIMLATSVNGHIVEQKTQRYEIAPVCLIVLLFSARHLGSILESEYSSYNFAWRTEIQWNYWSGRPFLQWNSGPIPWTKIPRHDISILYSSNRLLDIFIAAKMIDAYPKDNTIEQKTLQELLLDFLIAAIGWGAFIRNISYTMTVLRFIPVWSTHFLRR